MIISNNLDARVRACELRGADEEERSESVLPLSLLRVVHFIQGVCSPAMLTSHFGDHLDAARGWFPIFGDFFKRVQVAYFARSLYACLLILAHLMTSCFSQSVANVFVVSFIQ
jgi:hypothetical protein